MEYQLAKKHLDAEIESRKYELLLAHERTEGERTAIEYHPDGESKRIEHAKPARKENG